MKKLAKNDFVIIVEPKANNINYSKAYRKILNEQIVNEIVVAFFDSDQSKVCGEIKSVSIKGKKPKRILVLNENSSYDSVTNALNWVVESKNNGYKDIVSGSTPIALCVAP